MSTAALEPNDTTGLRTGAELVRATKPFTIEDRARTWRLLAGTFAVWGAATAVGVLAPWWPLQLVGAIVAGLTNVRLFIFYHDHLHGALFHDSPLGKLIMRAVGIWTLNPPSVWKETHDYHHQNNAKLLGASIGSYPVATVRMWATLTPMQRAFYAGIRHPVNMMLGYFTVFSLGMCIAPFKRAPRQHWQGPFALVAHWGIIAAATYFLGWKAAFFGLWLPVVIATAVGGYLFYAQHNFPGMQLRDRKKWEYWFAAVHSSSMFDMHPIMHWFTGNIGYHHVHHLNHKIPFYRLPEAMAAMPELQNPGRTSWAPSDVRACLRLALWDPDQNRMVGWDAVK